MEARLILETLRRPAERGNRHDHRREEHRCEDEKEGRHGKPGQRRQIGRPGRGSAEAASQAQTRPGCMVWNGTLLRPAFMQQNFA